MGITGSWPASITPVMSFITEKSKMFKSTLYHHCTKLANIPEYTRQLTCWLYSGACNAITAGLYPFIDLGRKTKNIADSVVMWRRRCRHPPHGLTSQRGVGWPWIVEHERWHPHTGAIAQCLVLHWAQLQNLFRVQVPCLTFTQPVDITTYPRSLMNGISSKNKLVVIELIRSDG